MIEAAVFERYRVDGRRVRLLKRGERGAGPVVYWLNREQRLADNWPLIHAQDLALCHQRGLLVAFCLQSAYLQASGRHFRFMLEGLKELASGLAAHGIGFLLLTGEPPEVLPPLLDRLDAHSLVTDFNPLRLKGQWQQSVAGRITVEFHEVDGHNIVPCWHASGKKEFAAYTFRPKIQRLLPEFLTDFPPLVRHPYPCDVSSPPIDWLSLTAAYPAKPAAYGRVPEPGEKAGKAALQDFIDQRLAAYERVRNDPLALGQSGLSPYFHFGQLAPQRAALAISAAEGMTESRAAFLEELIVRRELADNFCYYCGDYDRFAGFPDWAKATLDAHRRDPRQHLYSEQQFRDAETHEELWNCCQRLLVRDGRLHGYLRMYWAKKILEWSESPEEALRIGLLLNDAYAYDGRDPNGYVGVAWSVGGVHDRAWPERPVFGKIRYMNENGCRRKFDVTALLAREGGQAATG